MPIYEFICDSCQNKFEKIKKISEGNLPERCPECGLSASRNRNPSSFSVICKSLKNDANNKSTSDQSLTSNKTSSSVIKISNGKQAVISNCYFQNFDNAISAENVIDMTVKNVTFKDVKNPIEHRNSEIDLKNVSYEKS